MLDKWIFSNWSDVGMVVLSGVVVYAAILLYTRIVGLRSFSKMSAADFAMTLAAGSVFASTISGATPTLLIGLTALATLFAGQALVSYLRRRFQAFHEIIDNRPLLLMARDRMLPHNLHRANVTESDIYAKLREANVINSQSVFAVVFETTGDISVLHSQNPDALLERDIVQHVVDHELLFDPPHHDSSQASRQHAGECGTTNGMSSR